LCLRSAELIVSLTAALRQSALLIAGAGQERYGKGYMNRRALIVDDEPAICDLIRKVLQAAGMEALTLTRSTEATGLLEEGKFDVVFLDLHMASPDGIELARQMRRTESNRKTPIILPSDDQRPSAMSVGFEAGASFFLYKPIAKDRLLKLIRATQGTMEHDRRRTRRISLESRVLLQFGAEELEAQSVDISPSGMLVRSDRTLPPGSPVSIHMHLSEKMRPVVSEGSVVRIAGGNRMGIHFDRLAPAEAERLQEFLLPLIAGG
jgi:DNA-binding response OmpR family regulator